SQSKSACADATVLPRTASDARGVWGGAGDAKAGVLGDGIPPPSLGTVFESKSVFGVGAGAETAAAHDATRRPNATGNRRRIAIACARSVNASSELLTRELLPPMRLGSCLASVPRSAPSAYRSGRCIRIQGGSAGCRRAVP